MDARDSTVFLTAQHKNKDVTWLNKSSGGYEIATVDFARVRIPFLIAAWILFASLAKIGETNNLGTTLELYFKHFRTFQAST